MRYTVLRGSSIGQRSGVEKDEYPDAIRAAREAMDQFPGMAISIRDSLTGALTSHAEIQAYIDAAPPWDSPTVRNDDA